MLYYGEQIADAILAAVAEEREECAKILDEAAGQLIGGNRRARGIDAHVAWVLEDRAARLLRTWPRKKQGLYGPLLKDPEIRGAWG